MNDRYVMEAVTMDLHKDPRGSCWRVLRIFLKATELYNLWCQSQNLKKLWWWYNERNINFFFCGIMCHIWTAESFRLAYNDSLVKRSRRIPRPRFNVKSSFKFLPHLFFLILLYHLPFVILHLNPALFQVSYSEFAIRPTWGYYYLYANKLWGATKK